MSKRRGLVTALVICASCSDGAHGTSSDAAIGTDGSTGHATAGRAATEGIVTVIAVDGTTGQPIPAATVSVDGDPPSAIGAVGLPLRTSTGAHELQVASSGYLGAVRRIGVGSRPTLSAIELIPTPAAQTVDASGAIIDDGAASITVPAGAVADGTQLGEVALDVGGVARFLPQAQFETDDEIVHRVVAGLTLQLSSAPTQTLTVTLPVPAAPAGATITVWVLGADGRWQAPAAPASRTTTAVTFEIAAAGTYGVSFDQDVSGAQLAPFAADDLPPPIVVSAPAGGTVDEPTENGTETVAITPGMPIPDGSTVHAPDGLVRVVDAHGDDVQLAPASDATFAHCLDLTLCDKASSDVSIRGSAVEVSDSAFVPPHPRTKLIIRTRAKTIGGVRGTVFELDDDECTNIERTIDHVQVFEGDVVVDAEPEGISALDLSAGDDLRVCSNCAPAAEPACTCIDNDPQAFAGPTFSSATFSGSFVNLVTDPGPIEECRPNAGLYSFDVSLPGSLSMNGAVIGDGTGVRDVSFDAGSCSGSATRDFGDIDRPFTEDYIYALDRVGGALELKVTALIRCTDPQSCSGTCSVSYSSPALPAP